jgi:hypothetical protein
MGRVCSTIGEKRNEYTLLLRKPEGKKLLGSPRPRWMDNIKIDFRGIEWVGID